MSEIDRLRAELEAVECDLAELREWARATVDNCSVSKPMPNGTTPDKWVRREELDEANHWRERHSKDAEAYGKQAQENWKKLTTTQAEAARLRGALEELQLCAGSRIGTVILQMIQKALGKEGE